MAYSRFDKNAISTLTSAYVLATVARGAEIFFFVWLFSEFSVDQVGLYSWGIAVSAFFGIALDLGTTQVLIREFSRRSIDIGLAVRSGLLIRAPVLLAGLFVLLAWDRLWRPAPEVFWTAVLASLIQLFISAESLCYAWLKSHQRQTLANALAMFDPVGRLAVLGVMFLILDTDNAVGLLEGIASWHVVLFVVSASIVGCNAAQNPKGQSRPSTLSSIKQRLLLPGLTFGLIGLITVTQNRLDWLLISHYNGKAELANYSVANKAYEILMLMSGIAMATMYPWLCGRSGDALFERKMNTITALVLSGGAAVALSAALYLPGMLGWIWGDKYEPAYGLLRMLLPVSVFSVAVMILYYRLIAKGMEGRLLKASVLVTLLQSCINVTLISTYGGVGAVFGMGTLAVGNLLCYWWIAGRVGIVTPRHVLRQVTFITVMCLLALALAQLAVPAGIGVIILMAASVLGWFILLLTFREKQMARVYLWRLGAQKRVFRAREV